MTVSIKLGTLGAIAGGESTGKPGSCGVDEVKTDVVSVAIDGGDATVDIGTRSSGTLFTEEEGLTVSAHVSSDLRGDVIEANDVESLLSPLGFVNGGGMLTLGRSTAVLVV